MKRDIKDLSCSSCSLQNCLNQDSTYPKFCPTIQKTDEEELEELKGIYGSDDIDGKIARTSAKIESEFYGKKTRVEETVIFIKRMGFKKVGIACCVGLVKEAEKFAKILEVNNIDYYMVVCKVGSESKLDMNVEPEEVLVNGKLEPMCNPVLQARILNREKSEFNILIGLCVGHDSLFMKHSKAPVSTLIAKDRVTGHNPAAALYSEYYAALWNEPIEE